MDGTLQYVLTEILASNPFGDRCRCGPLRAGRTNMSDGLGAINAFAGWRCWLARAGETRSGSSRGACCAWPTAWGERGVQYGMFLVRESSSARSS
jgi:hypothetical protein